MGCIYKITNTINNKIYIGKTVYTAKQRWLEHLNDAKHNKCNSKLHRAINKYGKDNFLIEVIEENLPEERLGEKEQYYIKKYNSYYDGYNSTFGGDGESQVDFEKIKLLFLEGKTCTEIKDATGYTSKTISNRLKAEGYEFVQHQGNKNKGRSVIFNNNVFPSLTLLANHLKENYKEFSDKKVSTIISGIHKGITNKRPYCGYYFDYENKNDDIYQRALKTTYNYNTKLTEDDVRYIKSNYIPRDKEFGSRGLAKKFGVNHSSILGVVNKKTWKHIEDSE